MQLTDEYIVTISALQLDGAVFLSMKRVIVVFFKLGCE